MYTTTAGTTAFEPSLTAAELSKIFISSKRQVRKYNPDAEFLDCLSYAIGLLSINRQDFTESQFISLTRAYHDSHEATTALRILFRDWLEFMRLHKKIRTDNIFEEVHRFI